MAMTLPDPSFVIAGSELCYLPTFMLPEPLPRICSEVGLQDSIQAFGVVQQDLVLRDIIRFDGKGFIVVKGILAGFEENAFRGMGTMGASVSSANRMGAGDVDALLPKNSHGSPRCQGMC